MRGLTLGGAWGLAANLCLVLVLAISTLSYRFVERPAMNLRRRSLRATPTRRARALGVLTVAITVFTFLLFVEAE